jgi:ATP-binding cassette subfamily B protein
MGVEGIIIGHVPRELEKAAAEAGFPGGRCAFSVRSDLTLSGDVAEVWLVVSSGSAATFGAEPGEPLTGPFALSAVEKVRVMQAVGSAFLQFQIRGLFVDAVRFSNARREAFDRARQEIERLTRGEQCHREALVRPSDRECPQCGLPLPARGATCPRCSGTRGAFVRALLMMRPYWAYSLLLLALLVVRVGLTLVPPYLVRLLVDGVLLPRTNVEWLRWFVLGLLGVNALVCVVNILIGRASVLVGTRIGKEMRETLHDKLTSLNVEYFDRNSVGALMSRVLYDLEYFTGFVQQVAEGFLLNLLMVLGIGAVLFSMNWRLALVVMLPVPLVVTSSAFFLRYIKPRYFPLWDSRSKMAQLLSGVLSGIRMVKAFGQEERERTRFSESAVNVRDAERSLRTSTATFNPIMVFLFGLGGLIIWWSGGDLVLQGVGRGGITLGTLMAFFSYVGMFYTPIHTLSMFSNWATGFVSAAQRVFEVLDSTTELPEDPDPVVLGQARGEIEFRNVTFGYDPHVPVLKNVSFRIEPGQFIGIVGKSGSGKTTLVNLMCCFYHAQEGQVLVDGVDLRRASQHSLHQNVALVLQDPFLMRASIHGNIAYGRPGAAPAEVIMAAKAANAHEFISRMHAGYDTKLGERGAGLSGGERQRVTIARALLREPRILILDEATSSVDTESEQEIQRALTELSKGRTTIVVAHRLSTLKSADRILVFDDGRKVEEGSHEELMDLDGTYANLVRIQTELSRIEQDTDG